jgi:hypothetical protein
VHGSLLEGELRYESAEVYAFRLRWKTSDVDRTNESLVTR